jgi:hypothetical protein
MYPKPFYSARIPFYQELEKFDNQEGDQEAGYRPAKDERIARVKPRRSNQVLSTLESWVSRGHDLVIVYPVPEQGFDVGNELFAQRPIIASEDQLPDLSTSYEVFKERVNSSYRVLDKVKGDQVVRIYLEKLFCSEEQQRCFASQGKVIYFGRDNHVSPLGSGLIVTEVAKVLGLNIPGDF